MPEVASLPPEPVRHLEVWAECLSAVLGQISGTPLTCALLAEAPPEVTARAEDDLWILGSLAGGLRGELSFRVPAASIRALAQMFMGEPVSPDGPPSADSREATIELLRQVAGQVASVLRASWGELQLHLDPAAGAPSWPASLSFWLRAGEGKSAPTVAIDLSAALAAALRAGHDEAAVASGTGPSAASGATAAGDGARASSRPATEPGSASLDLLKLDLLKDVELALTLRFGSRRMTLGEVLELSPGSVVDLDRKVAEPVDVLVDGRLVARGEVVVLEGNYGLRVTEIGPAN